MRVRQLLGISVGGAAVWGMMVLLTASPWPWNHMNDAVAGPLALALVGLGYAGLVVAPVALLLAGIFSLIRIRQSKRHDRAT